MPWIWLVGSLIRGVPHLLRSGVMDKQLHLTPLVWRLPHRLASRISTDSGGTWSTVCQMLCKDLNISDKVRPGTFRRQSIRGTVGSCVYGTWQYFCHFDDIRLEIVHEPISIENFRVATLLLTHLLPYCSVSTSKRELTS